MPAPPANTRSSRSSRSAASRPTATRRTGAREQAAQSTRENILRAATRVFARHGYEGGSVEKISSAARSFDRMIYYYFGSKQGLFIEVLEAIYRHMNEAESRIELCVDDPAQALQAVIRFMLGYYRKHPEFVTLLNAENQHKGKHICKSLRAREYSSPAIEVLRQLLASGQAQGLFRPDVAARDIYLLIAACGYFYMSNRHTLSAFLGQDLMAAQALAHWERFVIDSVLRTVAALPQQATPKEKP